MSQVSRIGFGLALLVLVAGDQAAARGNTCEVDSLKASKHDVGSVTRAMGTAIRRDREPGDARLERRLARTDCDPPVDAGSLGRRLQAALVPEAAAAATTPDAAFTPLVMSVLAEPNAVTGSDGRAHLVYEVELTNATPAPWPIAAIEVLDGDDPEQVLLSIEGDQVATKVQLLAGAAPVDSVPPGASAVAFLHVPVEAGAEIPASLVHRLTLSLPDGLPDSIRVLIGLPPDAEVLEQVGAPTPVADRAPVVLGPLLASEGWIAADGCCTATRHVRAVQSINTQLLNAQRFAIDWEQVNDEDRIFVGDRHALESYFASGDPVLAVADARVAATLDGLEEAVPGGLPAAIALTEAHGNHVVLDLGDGRFVLYAHLIPGSIEVAEGDQVRRGGVLGLLGNSGNSLALHLHLHVMSTASGLAANGLPYVFDGYELHGQVPSTEAFDEAEATGEPVEIVPVPFPGAHSGDLPLDQSVLRFPK